MVIYLSIIFLRIAYNLAFFVDDSVIMDKLAFLTQRLWGEKARLRYLLIAATLLLFTLLDGREIWTQEHRWADIVFGMFYRHDFLHPYLGQNNYYDKPLLSYWLIALAAKLNGDFSVFTLRLPSALAGLLAVWSIYQLGTLLKNKSLGFLSAWLLLTTFYFVFWARTSSADMLNLAGSLFAVTWYMQRRAQADFFDYFVFFFILALTSLCKGLVGMMVPLLAVITDLYLTKSWLKHLGWPLFLGFIPALILYLLPFLASSYIGGQGYAESGLYLVYRENFLRYFQPFDHQGPIYTYLVYLPLYLFPWIIFFIPALLTLPRRFKQFSFSSQWITITFFLLFIFFTLSGSRRSYYILPVVPFAILFTADWLLQTHTRWHRFSTGVIVSFFILLFLSLDLAPAWYYAEFGINRFAVAVKKEASLVMPWQNWHVVMLDAESKLNFYLQLPPSTKNFGYPRGQQTLLTAWPILKNKPKQTIFITKRAYVAQLRPFFVGYRELSLVTHAPVGFLADTKNDPIAFIPMA